ncbi:hypothetical protein K431DRAFT_283606 [Polychaeton citri CBS 116435]|uniref:Uncharacterized protein n=1 Tax=Polychaeton citri CBS 116435 TaxID=1314669 RepID=A0A9P4QDA3_9PEZI|nr:hypothetical protein K431DRAFT_283606 [Polychaeton citri CBS 116435]
MSKADGVTSSLNKLKISERTSKKATADSWEDEGSDNEVSTPVDKIAPDMLRTPGPPPPTPASPSWHAHSTTKAPQGLDGAFDSPPGSAPNSRPGSSWNTPVGDRRPEKSTAVASRLIAAGIGQRAPKRTKEEREYDRAMKAQEIKKREEAKQKEIQKEQEAEQAKRAIWDD